MFRNIYSLRKSIKTALGNISSVSLSIANSFPLITYEFCQNQVRNSSFQSSHKVRPLEEYPEVKVVKDPKLWKFVEDILPLSAIPKLTPKTEYPTTWQPPKQVRPDVDYLVARTKNHMIPVYLQTTHRGLRRVTLIRRIQGNMWNLEKEICEVVKSTGKRYAGRVNEMSGILRVHGDHVVTIRNFLIGKGF